MKKVATKKVGVDDESRNVPQDATQAKEKIIEFIKAEVRLNNKITRQAIAEHIGISVKTIQRLLKEIDNLKYIGRGKNGHWELEE